MNQKKGSKNAIENRSGKHVDPRGEQVMIMVNGKQQMVFEKDGKFFDKKGVEVTL